MAKSTEPTIKPTPMPMSKPVAALVWPVPAYKIDDDVKIGDQSGTITGLQKHIHKGIPVWRYKYTPNGVPVAVANGLWASEQQIKTK